MRPRWIKVRARSAKDGSGTEGWSALALVFACFLRDDDIIAPVKMGLRFPGVQSGRVFPCAAF